MPPEDERADVDFVVGADLRAGDPRPVPDPSGRPGASRRPLAIAATVLVGGALVARAVTGHHTTSTAAPSATPAPPAPTRTFGRPSPVAVSPAPDQDLAFCPPAGDGGTVCSTGHRIPSAVFEAVLTHFPGARRTSVLEERLRDTGGGAGGILWFRRVGAVVGSQTILVQVHRRLDGDSTQGSVTVEGARTVVHFTELTGSLTVDVRVTGPAQRGSSFGAVMALADDARVSS